MNNKFNLYRKFSNKKSSFNKFDKSSFDNDFKDISHQLDYEDYRLNDINNTETSFDDEYDNVRIPDWWDGNDKEDYLEWLDRD